MRYTHPERRNLPPEVVSRCDEQASAKALGDDVPREAENQVNTDIKPLADCGPLPSPAKQDWRVRHDDNQYCNGADCLDFVVALGRGVFHVCYLGKNSGRLYGAAHLVLSEVRLSLQSAGRGLLIWANANDCPISHRLHCLTSGPTRLPLAVIACLQHHRAFIGPCHGRTIDFVV